MTSLEEGLSLDFYRMLAITPYTSSGEEIVTAGNRLLTDFNPNSAKSNLKRHAIAISKEVMLVKDWLLEPCGRRIYDEHHKNIAQWNFTPSALDKFREQYGNQFYDTTGLPKPIIDELGVHHVVVRRIETPKHQCPGAMAYEALADLMKEFVPTVNHFR